MDSGVSLQHQRLDSALGAPVPRFRQDGDSMQRELRAAHNETARLKALYSEKDQQCGRLEHALRAARKSLSDLESVRDSTNSDKQVAYRERDAAVRRADEATAYAKKLESKFLAGKGEYLVEQNTKLREAVGTLREDNELLKRSGDEMKSELEKATKEIEVLATALEMRAEELSIDGNMRAGLLFEVAHRRSESKTLEKQLAELKGQADTRDFENRELKAQLQNASSEVAMLSDRNARLSSDLSASASVRRELEAKIRTLAHERDVSLDFVADQSATLAEALLRSESAAAKTAEAQRAADESDSAFGALQSELGRLRSSTDAAQTALGKERHARTSAESRATTAETEAAAMRGEIASLRAQVAAVSAANDKAQLELGARGQEVAMLRSQLRAAQAEASSLSNQLSTEQHMVKSARQSLEDRLDKVSSELRSAVREREEARGIVQDTSARLTVARLETARHSQLLTEANGTIASMKAGWSEAQSRMVGQVTELRELLAEEQAVRHELTVELNMVGRTEAAKHQRTGDKQRAQPKRADVNTSMTSYASSTSPGKGPLKAQYIPRSALTAATLVRDALLAHGLDPALADEYLTARVRPTEVTVPQPFSAHVNGRSPERNYRPVAPVPDADSWHALLRAGTNSSASSATGTAAIPSTSAGMNAYSSPSKRYPQAAAPPAAPPMGAMSPGQEALDAARARVRARTGEAAGINYDSYMGSQAGQAPGQAGTGMPTVSYQSSSLPMPIPLLSPDDLAAAYEHTMMLPQ